VDSWVTHDNPQAVAYFNFTHRTSWYIPSSLLMSAFLSSVIFDSFNLSISSQQLAAAPLNDEDTELHTTQCTLPCHFNTR